jgi:hypothetical protein
MTCNSISRSTLGVKFSEDWVIGDVQEEGDECDRPLVPAYKTAI